MEYRITGRLAPTGTPWDRAILVPIEAVWDVHADHGDGEADHDGAEAHDHGHDHAHGHDHGHDHDHEGEIAARPVDETKLADGDNPGVPAIVVKPRSIADAYNLRLEYRAGDATLAVFPAEVLTRLYGTLGDARQVLALVAAGAQALVAAAILMVVAVHVLQRRRQIGALRAFGAPRAVVLAIVWLEAFAVLLVGLVLGFAVGYAAARVLSAKLGAASGIAMPVEFHAADVRLLLAFLIAAAVVTLLPAFLAYRQTPAQALRA
jgi:putative ABC transport system permease protein